MSFAGITALATEVTDLLKGSPGIIKPKRNIGGLIADVTVEEIGTDEQAITQHPVEKTADITDHAYPLPPTLRVYIGYSPSGSSSGGFLSNLENLANSAFGLDGGTDPVPLETIYQQYLDLKNNRELLEVQTGKRLYENMLIKTITLATNPDTENALFLTIELQNVILVETQTVQVPSNSVQKNPQLTGNQVNAGTKSAIPSPANLNSGAATQVLGN